MELANQIFFIIFALISLALFVGATNQYRSSSDKSESCIYLPISILLFSFSSICFGLALWIHKFLLTIASTSLIVSALMLVLLYRVWNEKVLSRVQIIFITSALIGICLYYDFLRTSPNTFKQRVALIALTHSALLAWQIWELRKNRKISRDAKNGKLIFLTMITLIGEVIRVCWVGFSGGPNNVFLYIQDGISLSLLWIGYGGSILIYVALEGLYLEKHIRREAIVSKALEATLAENEKISDLLKEKERLIYGLMKANKTAATGALSASIAHELNQPLGASNLNIQFLKMKLEKGVLNPDLGREILNSLEHDNKRAATIVNSLKSIFSESGPAVRDVQVDVLISNVLHIVQPELKSKNIQIQLKVGSDLVALASSAEIEQVVLNLLNNAIQSLASSGTLQRRITIEAIKVANAIQICISDNGPGVAPEFKPQLFELLSTTKKTGMGLGLWLCKHIITRYAGSIHYQEAPLGGAKFVVELPQAL